MLPAAAAPGCTVGREAICTVRSGRGAGPPAMGVHPAGGAEGAVSDGVSPERVRHGASRGFGLFQGDTVMWWTTRDG
ncbi:hypothetical protein GCM10012284_23090 [Mangrovihabitans endophyticus]|uniref:Uncharacterized protein n=1 Tax=Mangrovihabitans endophyticus TaxID=1751298 RepID=A0A8J3BXA9_9ACTN|nr:hypothetical protein GCM10012284_23090 [Mangrovihabitans endophyticus]